MNDRQLVSKNITIKSETVSPTSKKIIISSSLASPSALKKESSLRLPSFKPPRDLLLASSTTGQTNLTLKHYINVGNKSNKKKYTPNVNIFRKKGANNTSSSESLIPFDGKSPTLEQTKKTLTYNKKKNSNFIQTEGVFSQGLGPGKAKAYNSSYSEKSYNELAALEKPKISLNQIVNKNKEDAKLKKILKDDFLHDPKNLPDLRFAPSSLPNLYNAQHKFYDPRDIETTFQNLQVKKEKLAAIKNKDIKDDKSEIYSTFEDNDNPKLLLFEFPKILLEADDAVDKRKSFKSQSANVAESKAKFGNLSSAGEGHWGFLRIHESGNAYFVIGKTIIPFSLSRHIGRQELISTNLDQSKCKGEVINLGTIDASFTCSTHFDEIR